MQRKSRYRLKAVRTVAGIEEWEKDGGSFVRISLPIYYIYCVAKEYTAKICACRNIDLTQSLILST